jgi:enoyl-CoA hydratase/carnithine racemase
MGVVRKFGDYEHLHENAKLERDNGILQVTLHSDGADLSWGWETHERLVELFEQIARDVDNRVIIVTGTGETFSDTGKAHIGGSQEITAAQYAPSHYSARRLLTALLDIEAPMIAAINGPATMHAEVGLLCDVVLASDTATFADLVHASSGVVPGDGVQVWWPALVGLNRARYLMLTGQVLSAKEALDLGVVNEVMSREDLLPRAWELARHMRELPDVMLRFTRPVMLQQMKRAVLDSVPLGLALEGLAITDYFPARYATEGMARKADS